MRAFIILFLTFHCYNFNACGQNFGSFASAMYIEVNGSTQFYNCDAHNTVNAIGSIQYIGNLGTFVQGSGLLIIRGAEIKTWKGNNANVCTPLLYYRVYPVGSPSGSFENFNINYFCNCSGGAFVCGGGPCGGNDQKWQTPGSGSGLNIDLTSFSVGTFELEVYFEIPGNNNGTSGCQDVNYDSNGGSNYKMTFTIEAAVMPVQLIAFNAQSAGSDVLLSWSTTSEVNNQYFLIEKSYDGISFHPFAEVAGAGNSQRKITYKYIHKDMAQNEVYYRLKQVDFDGFAQYSDVIKYDGQKDSNTRGILKIFPNPATSEINILSDTNGSTEIYDLSGMLLKQFTIYKGVNNLDLRGLKTSNQIVARVISDSGIETTKHILIHE